MRNEQDEILRISQEECAEVIQAISKVFRFGFDGEHNGKTNHQRLTEELGDLLCMIELMMQLNIVNESAVYKASLQKRNKLHQWSNIFDGQSDLIIN